MKNRGVAILFLTAAALCSLSAAQRSKPAASSTTKDPLKTANKPLTPKSTTKPRSGSPPSLPKASNSTRKTDAELARLERQGVKSGPAKSATSGDSKAAAVKASAIKPSGEPSKGGSGINSSYQKPKVPKKN